MADLVEAGEWFQAEIPGMTPLFLNLPAMEHEKLEREGGFFGWVLRLLKDRKSRSRVFERVLVRVLRHLEALTHEERLRWEDLLSYIRALVYHNRTPSEWSGLQTLIETSIQDDDLRQEVSRMGKTIADVLKDEGRAEGRTEGRTEGRVEATRSNLFQLLRRRFGELPQDTVDHIEGTDDLEQLNGWFGRAITAESLEEVGIPLS